MNQYAAWLMIRRRAVAAGITAYLANGGARESRTTKLYDRTKQRLTQDEVERIRL